jgi:hypothetical protein
MGEENMLLRGMKIGFTGLAMLALLASSAAAQTTYTQVTKKRVVTNRDNTISVSRDEEGRTRTRIIVQRRSYLDAGTNVKPGERKYSDYVYGPTYSATSVMDGTAFGVDRQIRPGPFDLPGARNPMQW